MEKTHFIDKEPNKYEALAEIRSQQIRSMNEDQAIRTLSNLENAWGLHEKDFLKHQMLGYDQFLSDSCFNKHGAVSINDIDLAAIKDIKKKKVYYDVRVIMKFIDDLDRMEEEYFSGNIGRMKSIYEKDPEFNNDDNGGGDIR